MAGMHSQKTFSDAKIKTRIHTHDGEEGLGEGRRRRALISTGVLEKEGVELVMVLYFKKKTEERTSLDNHRYLRITRACLETEWTKTEPETKEELY